MHTYIFWPRNALGMFGGVRLGMARHSRDTQLYKLYAELWHRNGNGRSHKDDTYLIKFSQINEAPYSGGWGA